MMLEFAHGDKEERQEGSMKMSHRSEKILFDQIKEKGALKLEPRQGRVQWEALNKRIQILQPSHFELWDYKEEWEG